MSADHPIPDEVRILAAEIARIQAGALTRSIGDLAESLRASRPVRVTSADAMAFGYESSVPNVEPMLVIPRNPTRRVATIVNLSDTDNIWVGTSRNMQAGQGSFYLSPSTAYDFFTRSELYVLGSATGIAITYSQEFYTEGETK